MGDVHKGLFTITKISAKGLPDADREIGGGTSDPYVVFNLQNGTKKSSARTKTMQNARNVLWPDSLKLPFSAPGSDFDSTLHISVIEDTNDADDIMGTVEVLLSGRGGKVLQVVDGKDSLYSFQLSFEYAFAQEAAASQVPTGPPVPLAVLAVPPSRATPAITASGFRRKGFMTARRLREERELGASRP